MTLAIGVEVPVGPPKKVPTPYRCVPCDMGFLTQQALSSHQRSKNHLNKTEFEKKLKGKTTQQELRFPDLGLNGIQWYLRPSSLANVVSLGAPAEAELGLAEPEEAKQNSRKRPLSRNTRAGAHTKHRGVTFQAKVVRRYLEMQAQGVPGPSYTDYVLPTCT